MNVELSVGFLCFLKKCSFFSSFRALINIIWFVCSLCAIQTKATANRRWCARAPSNVNRTLCGTHSSAVRNARAATTPRYAVILLHLVVHPHRLCCVASRRVCRWAARYHRRASDRVQWPACQTIRSRGMLVVACSSIYVLNVLCFRSNVFVLSTQQSCELEFTFPYWVLIAAAAVLMIVLICTCFVSCFVFCVCQQFFLKRFSNFFVCFVEIDML